jgi:uncharacterized LabA/DUF88 family protein
VKIKKTIAYIDGFNLYFGLKERGWKCYYWLNLWELCRLLLKPDQKLVTVKYFTSKVQNPPDKRQRQYSYLHALSITPGIERYFGKYEMSYHTCEGCGRKIEIPLEKMSDVQLATQMISDAFKDNFDVALLVSGDKDLVPIVELCRQEFPEKRIVAVFPPMRSCDDLRYAANAFIHVTETELKKSLFPNQITDSLGRLIECPKEWS